MTSHVKPRPYVCRHCDAGFTSSRQLESHAILHQKCWSESYLRKMPIGKASSLMLVFLRAAGGKPNHSVFEECWSESIEKCYPRKNLVSFAFYPPAERSRYSSVKNLGWIIVQESYSVHCVCFTLDSCKVHSLVQGLFSCEKWRRNHCLSEALIWEWSHNVTAFIETYF